MEPIRFNPSTKLALPLFLDTVQAGFPSPAEDFVDTSLDLNSFLVSHPAATFFVRVQGDSMIDIGIKEKDTLVVDKSIVPRNNSVVIARLNGEFTVKLFLKDLNGTWLVPANTRYKPIFIKDTDDFEIWGVVTYTIHKFN